MRRPFGWQLMATLALTAACSLPSAAERDGEHIADIVTRRCETCHGQGGQGSNSTFPKLSGQNVDYLVQQMFNFKSGARRSTLMEPQLADLTGNDIVQLARHFGARPLTPETTSDGSRAAAGRKLYLNGNPASGVSACAACHGPRGRGALMLPRLAGQHAEYLELQLRRFIERSRGTDQTLMHSVAARMTDEEIRAVSYFLSGLD